MKTIFILVFLWSNGQVVIPNFDSLQVCNEQGKALYDKFVDSAVGFYCIKQEQEITR